MKYQMSMGNGSQGRGWRAMVETKRGEGAGRLYTKNSRFSTSWIPPCGWVEVGEFFADILRIPLPFPHPTFFHADLTRLT